VNALVALRIDERAAIANHDRFDDIAAYVWEAPLRVERDYCHVVLTVTQVQDLLVLRGVFEQAVQRHVSPPIVVLDPLGQVLAVPFFPATGYDGDRGRLMHGFGAALPVGSEIDVLLRSGAPSRKRDRCPDI
jgi:hypothetical protein